MIYIEHTINSGLLGCCIACAITYLSNTLERDSLLLREFWQAIIIHISIGSVFLEDIVSWRNKLKWYNFRCGPCLTTNNDMKLILYSGKVWWGEGLVNLENHQWFAKLKPSDLVVTIKNPNPINFLLYDNYLQNSIKSLS